MLALQASRGWNYQATPSSGPVTVSLYVDQSTISGSIQSSLNGDLVLVATGVPGLQATVLTSQAAAESNLVGGLAIAQAATGYSVGAEISVGSNALVPGTPLLVGSTLTQGATSTPYAGVTETVLSVGTVPGASACPTPATGAQVRYTYQSTNYTISYVPGCGITQVVGPSGVPFTLTSVGSYPTIGNLSIARKIQSASLVSTARSLLGLERNDFPAAKLFR
ncbi:MAG: hypothetical protein JO225_06480 [Candidatus Eremiobacteraeota bacterium]|nr:hypothetical protein [Candidatus Eremiobacteraeota bacterium]